MKNKIQATDREKLLSEQDFIVSKTDTKGRITYCNRTFIDISGYSEKELLGSQHNIVRHPDMPKVVFYLLWESLNQGKEFFGYVKNLCKDGGFYWVFANLTPTYDPKGRLVGHYSVRRHPASSALNLIKPLYKEMLQAEQRAGAKDAVQASLAVLDDKLTEYRADYEHFILEL